jgi:hypothetical protein
MTASSTPIVWITNRLDELVQWLLALDRPFAFLLALPFIIALAALGAEVVRQRRTKVPPRPNGETG